MDIEDIGVTLAGRRMEVPLMNGAGVVKEVRHVELMCRSTASAIVVGSGTVKGGTGNEGNIFDYSQFRTLNSLGLPNMGKSGYERELPEMLEMAKNAGKHLCFSIAGNQPEDYAIMALMAKAAGVTWIELNFGCPNVWAQGKQKKIISYMPGMVARIIELVRDSVGPEMTISVKFSPIFDRVLLEEVADIVKSPSCPVQIVVTTNTVPNCVAFRPNGKHLLVPQHKGYAGGAGRMIKEIGQGQVQMWREEVGKTLHIVGVGGINTGLDALEYIWAGADAVQMVSVLYQNHDLDVRPLERIAMEYYDQLLG